MCECGVTKSVKEVQWSVPTIKCEGCANKLKSALGAQSGVQDVSVRVPEKWLSVTYSSCSVTEQQLRELVLAAGFSVESI